MSKLNLAISEHIIYKIIWLKTNNTHYYEMIQYIKIFVLTYSINIITMVIYYYYYLLTWSIKFQTRCIKHNIYILNYPRTDSANKNIYAPSFALKQQNLCLKIITSNSQQFIRQFNRYEFRIKYQRDVISNEILHLSNNK